MRLKLKPVVVSILWCFVLKILIYLLHIQISGDSNWTNAFHRWDSYWYARIAEFGYPLEASGSLSANSVSSIAGMSQSAWAFFPAYPMIAKILAIVLSLDILQAMEVLSWMACIIVPLLFSIFANQYCEPDEFKASLRLFFLFPFSIFIFLHYSDGLYVISLLLIWIFVGRRRLILAGLILALAVLIRPNALFVIPAVLLYSHRINNWGELWRQTTIKATAISPLVWFPMLSFGAYSVYQFKMTGHPFAFAAAQKGWDRTFSFPWKGFFKSGDPATQIESAYTLMLILLTALLWRRFTPAFKIMMLLGILMPLISGSVDSMTRFTIALLPIFVTVVQTPSYKKFQVAILASMLILQIGCIILWCIGSPLMA